MAEWTWKTLSRYDAEKKRLVSFHDFKLKMIFRNLSAGEQSACSNECSPSAAIVGDSGCDCCQCVTGLLRAAPGGVRGMTVFRCIQSLRFIDFIHFELILFIHSSKYIEAKKNGKKNFFFSFKKIFFFLKNFFFVQKNFFHECKKILLSYLFKQNTLGVQEISQSEKKNHFYFMFHACIDMCPFSSR